MKIQLTPLAARFVESMNAQNSAGFMSCFTPDAIVEDEGQTHRGTAEIQAWIEAAFAKYQPVLEVAATTSSEPEYVITGSVSGTFPGSPIVLHYHLTIVQDRIAVLRCVP